MTDALSAVAGSMSNDLARLTTISRNLVNGTTPGYKGSIAHMRSFPDVLALAGSTGARPARLAVSMPQMDIATDYKAGALKLTGNPFDFAIEDDGYFEVMTDMGPAYTRQGNFRLDARGRLVTEAGHAVQGLSGDIMLASSQPSVDRNGNVLDGDKPAGQLKVVKFADQRLLRMADAGLFLQGDAVFAAGEGKVRQAHLEMSNVSSMGEMVKLMETTRHFESAQKVIQGVDEMHERAMRKLGEF